MMTSELPQELLEEILCRVPATSLKRLRTTCKQWNHLFNDKKFLKKHSDKAAKQHLFLTLSEEFRVCLLNINLRNGIPSAEVTGELSLNKVNIRHVSHCDGLLVCTIKGDTRVIVWNPCTGQIKWIQTPKNNDYHDFVLGYYQDKKSCDKSYKILGYRCFDDLQETELYDINSNSWRNLGVTPIPDYHIECFNEYHRVSLKGKAYWFANDWKENQESLISFDYTRERFERLRLPYQYDCFENMTLSVVGEEKLSVLLQREKTSREEIWVTTKIDDETKELSWIKLLELEICIRVEMFLGSFVFDQEKKIFTCCERPYYPKTHSVIKVHIIGRIVMPHQGLFQ